MPDIGPVSTLTARTAATLADTDSFYLDDGGGNDLRVTPAVLKQYLATATLAPAAALTADDPFELNQTWNAGGVTFTGFKVDITDTASAAGSLLADFQVGGASKASIRKDGFAFFEGEGLAVGASSANFTIQYVANQVSMHPTFALGWGSTSAAITQDLSLRRDAANTLAQRNGTNAQEHRWYATYASGTDYHREVKKSAKATLSSVSGATVTATGLIPAGAVLKGITTKVTTELGTGNGTTGYNVGDGVDADRWGAITGTAAGTSSDGTDATDDPAGTWSASARDVVLTAVGGNFDGTGVIEVYAFYDIVEAD